MSAADRDDLLRLAQTDARYPIPKEALLSALTSPPFIPTRSLINIRDAGTVPGSALPSELVYRCGALDIAAKDPEAVAWLSGHVKKIFDLRRGPERAAAPDPEVPGVENVWLDTVGAYPTPDLDKFKVDDGAPAWAEQLLSAAEMYKTTIRAILEHIRDQPGVPFLFHCTAGRDRTGMVGGLLQHLAGTAPDDVIFDYLLSRIGTEPAREKLVQFAMKTMDVEDVETPGFINLVSLRASSWNAFLNALNEKYGGWDGYVVKCLELPEEDLAKIKKNLRS